MTVTDGVALDITPARTADAEEILALQRAAYRIEAERYQDFGLPPLIETPADLVAILETSTRPSRRTAARGTVLAARRRDDATGVIVGTARAVVRGDTAHIGRISVLPRLHGQGIGRQLLAAIEQATAPVRRYALFTGHRSERNLRMYERAGYGRVGSERQSAAVVLIHLEKRVDAGTPADAL